MSQIGPRITLAYPAAAIGVERTGILSIARLLDRDFSFRGEQQAMSRRARGKDAIHHIDAETRVFDNFFGRAHSHHVAWLIGGEILECGFDELARALARFADAQASDGITGKSDFNSPLGGFFSESQVHSALDDAEERLRRAVAPSHLTRAPRHSRVPSHSTRCT